MKDKSMYEIVVYPENDQFNDLKIESILNSHKSIKEWLFILHDKDNKKPHYHIYLHFGRTYPCAQLLTMFNNEIKENSINEIRGRWKDILLYATHKNASSKYQYDNSEVRSNFDYSNKLAEILSSDTANDLILKYSNNEISFYQLWTNLTPSDKLKYNKRIEVATRVRNENLKLRSDRDMKVMYIYGIAGSGKTSFAKFYAKEVLKTDFYVSSSSNDPLCDYMGQKVIILDDLRADVFTYADLLKILDNHTNSSAKSRYYNKQIDADFLIITSIKNPIDFYRDYENPSEPIQQFIRRLNNVIMVGGGEDHLMSDIEVKEQYVGGQKEWNCILKNPLPISWKDIEKVFINMKESFDLMTSLAEWKAKNTPSDK